MQDLQLVAQGERPVSLGHGSRERENQEADVSGMKTAWWKVPETPAGMPGRRIGRCKVTVTWVHSVPSSEAPNTTRLLHFCRPDGVSLSYETRTSRITMEGGRGGGTVNHTIK